LNIPTLGVFAGWKGDDGHCCPLIDVRAEEVGMGGGPATVKLMLHCFRVYPTLVRIYHLCQQLDG